MNTSTKNTTATMSEIVFGNLRKIDGLKNITPESCCECISFCEDTMQYLTEKEKAELSKEDQDYQTLDDQIKNLCTLRKSLEDGTLTCSLRNKYSGEKNGT